VGALLWRKKKKKKTRMKKKPKMKKKRGKKQGEFIKRGQLKKSQRKPLKKRKQPLLFFVGPKKNKKRVGAFFVLCFFLWGLRSPFTT